MTFVENTKKGRAVSNLYSTNCSGTPSVVWSAHFILVHLVIIIAVLPTKEYKFFRFVQTQKHGVKHKIKVVEPTDRKQTWRSLNYQRKCIDSSVITADNFSVLNTISFYFKQWWFVQRNSYNLTPKWRQESICCYDRTFPHTHTESYGFNPMWKNSTIQHLIQSCSFRGNYKNTITFLLRMTKIVQVIKSFHVQSIKVFGDINTEIISSGSLWGKLGVDMSSIGLSKCHFSQQYTHLLVTEQNIEVVLE